MRAFFLSMTLLMTLAMLTAFATPPVANATDCDLTAIAIAPERAGPLIVNEIGSTYYADYTISDGGASWFVCAFNNERADYQVTKNGERHTLKFGQQNLSAEYNTFAVDLGCYISSCMPIMRAAAEYERLCGAGENSFSLDYNHTPNLKDADHDIVTVSGAWPTGRNGDRSNNSIYL